MQYQPRPLPPITDLLRVVDENWPAPPELFSISHLEEAIPSEGADDVFLGFPGLNYEEIIEDTRRPSLSYDAFRSPFVPSLPIQSEDATSSSFILTEFLQPPSPPPLVDFSSWSGSTYAMDHFEADTSLSLPLPSSRLREAYPTTVSSLPALIPLDTWGLESAQRQRERDPWVDPVSNGDGCCPRCGWSVSTPPVDPLAWLYD